ncbi:MAG: hypothetical protein EYC70_09010 [Planctomycetota bacterium]|nr:MAG: hypothetical protein EYC70_09010 [Planctomycetota bacterium]
MSQALRERLYALLPAIYRVQDAQDASQPLRALLAVMEGELDAVEGDIARLYENWFIETCEDWVIPYIADLLGVAALPSGPLQGFSPRAFAANTLAYRRGKGTVAVLEQLARDLTGLPARGVEFFPRLAATQHLQHVRHDRGATASLRDAGALELLGGAFGAIAHTADVRRIAVARGRHNLHNVGLFLWRLQAIPEVDVPAAAAEEGVGLFRFNVLGTDMPLFAPGRTEEGVAHLAGEADLPGPLRRRALYADLNRVRAARQAGGQAESVYLGPTPAFAISYEEDGERRSVAAAEAVACNLETWRRPAKGQVAVDPQTGRFAFAKGRKPAHVRVRCYRGGNGLVGGGCYTRGAAERLVEGAAVPVGAAGGPATLKAALEAWQSGGGQDAVLEVADSGTHTVGAIEVPDGRRLEIRAAEQQRPLVLLRAPWKIRLGAGAVLRLDGLWVAGSGLKLAPGDGSRLALRHCTLVPRDAFSLKAEPEARDHQVSLQRCVTGRLELPGEGSSLLVEECIVDGAGGKAPTMSAAGARVLRSTVLGAAQLRLLELATDCIFTGELATERRQQGCVRFCFLPLSSLTPRRYRCQPELALAQRARRLGLASAGALPAPERELLARRVRPCFVSERFGDPGYTQLAASCPAPIAEGGEDGLEMGVWNHLLLPRRLACLRASLDEYLRFGLEAGILLAT